MNLRLFLTATVLVATVLGASMNVRAQTADAVSGRILSVKCPAQLKRLGATGNIPLSSPRDVALGLAAGDQVQCVGPGYIDVLIATGTTRIIPSPKPFTIPPLPNDPQSPEDTEIAKALRHYGISGATRGNPAGSRILWPSENSVVLPQQFTIRWTPISQKIELAILSEAKDVTVWGPTEVDGEAGSLRSDAIVSALAAYKANPGGQGLVLTLTPSNSNNWEEAHFHLLRGKQEQELNAQLNFWKVHTDGLALRLGRGYTYARNRLFAEAAEEYEAALNIAPDSVYLLQQTIEANKMAGRTLRAKELQTHLDSLAKITNP